MKRPIKTKKQMQGIFMLLELSLLLCVTLFVYNCINWHMIAENFNTLLSKFNCWCGHNVCHGGGGNGGGGNAGF